MKKKLLLWFATSLFWTGDLISKLTFKYDSRIFAGWYIWFMEQSVKIQDKYNLDGPWKDTVEPGDF